MISSTCGSSRLHLKRLQRFIDKLPGDHRIYVEPPKHEKSEPGARTQVQAGECRLSARAPGAPAPQDDEQTQRKKAAWERRKARDFGYFLENVMLDVVTIGGSEAGLAHANLQKLKQAHPEQLPTVAELKSCLAALDRASRPSSDRSGTPLLQSNPLQFQPDPGGALDWSSMDSATFEQLDAQGVLGQFIQTQARAIERMVLPADLTTQPALLSACPHLQELRLVRPAMSALDLSGMKDLRRVELLEPVDHTLIAKTQVPLGCTVSSRAKRKKEPSPLSNALPSALATIPASPVATRPGPTPAELFKRKARLLIPSGHAAQPQLLRLIDSLGDHLNGAANTLSLDTWAPALIDTFTEWGGMDMFASACDKANRRPGCLRTPTKQETLPPYAALLKPQVLVFSQPEANYLDLSTLEGLKEVVVIGSDGTDWANRVRLPPGDCRLVVKSSGL